MDSEEQYEFAGRETTLLRRQLDLLLLLAGWVNTSTSLSSVCLRVESANQSN